MKYEVDTLIQIYKDSPTFKDGAIGKIIDRDPEGGGYAFVSLDAIHKENGDIGALLTKHVKWVDDSNFEPITFNRPKRSYKNLLYFLGGILLGAGGLYSWFTILPNG